MAVSVYGLSRNAGAGFKLSVLAFLLFLLPRHQGGWELYYPDPASL